MYNQYFTLSIPLQRLTRVVPLLPQHRHCMHVSAWRRQLSCKRTSTDQNRQSRGVSGPPTSVLGLQITANFTMNTKIDVTVQGECSLSNQK
uniref:Uncharacterized protein n=1 Tax=Serratia marcescens TaxID=615 RepID=U5TRC1_SERMA|nr:hypothetical protein SME10408_34 [Serratia marcescens]AGZ03863.1 hypothetical protein SME12620_34 [Serratia marcescens]